MMVIYIDGYLVIFIEVDVLLIGMVECYDVMVIVVGGVFFLVVFVEGKNVLVCVLLFIGVGSLFDL